MHPVHRLSPSSQSNIQRRHLSKHDDDDDDDNGDNEEDAIYEILLLTEYCSNGALIVSESKKKFCRNLEKRKKIESI